MFLPMLFVFLGATALVFAIFALWQSLRGAFGVVDPRLRQGIGTSVERMQLLDEKQALLGSIQDLRFDKEMGKLSDDDWQRLDEQLRERAREVLKLLDEDVEPYREQAERMIDEHLHKQRGASPYRDRVKKKKASIGGPEPITKTCSECGASNDADAAFCKRCGFEFDGPDAMAQEKESAKEAAAEADAKAEEKADASGEASETAEVEEAQAKKADADDAAPAEKAEAEEKADAQTEAGVEKSKVEGSESEASTEAESSEAPSSEKGEERK